MPHTLNKRYAEIRTLKKHIDDVEDFKNELIQAQSAKLAPRYYRYATFTALPGELIKDQLTALSAAKYTEDTGKSLATLAGGSEKFPKLTDAGFRSFIYTNDTVKKGEVRQYFCYLDHSKKAKVIGKMDFPEEYFETEQAAHVKRQLSRFMLRMENFDLCTINNYLDGLDTRFKQLVRDVQVVIEDMVRKSDNRIEGIETFCRDATTKSSAGGFLIFSENVEEKLPIYCPKCFNEILKPAINNWPESGQAIVFPPIPELLPFENDVYCTENLEGHRTHGRSDCLDLATIEKEINHIRDAFGEKEFVRINVKYKLKNHSGWLWIGVD